jgi:peptide/nickel transport system permease protein
MTGIGRRLLLLVPTVLGVLTLVFFLVHLIPGDPVEPMLGETRRAPTSGSCAPTSASIARWATVRAFLGGRPRRLGRSFFYSQAGLGDRRRCRPRRFWRAALPVALLIALPSAFSRRPPQPPPDRLALVGSLGRRLDAELLARADADHLFSFRPRLAAGQRPEARRAWCCRP